MLPPKYANNQITSGIMKLKIFWLIKVNNFFILLEKLSLKS
jgi:hypothetical protein